jgi:plasmid stabilization system protein ParE
MSEFVLHPSALKDLEEIWEYIAAENLDAADRVCEEIRQAIQSLVPFPHVGHSRPDLTSRHLRFQTVLDFVIAYASMKIHWPSSPCSTAGAIPEY